MSEQRRWRERQVWWHRIKGHRVIRGFNLLSPSSVLKCEDCDLIWTRSLL